MAAESTLPVTDTPVHRKQEKRSERLARRWGSLTSDVQDWVELKVTLLEIQLIKRVRQELFLRSGPWFLYGVAGVFLLIALALWAGELLGHPAWGFAGTGAAVGTLAGLTQLLHHHRHLRQDHGTEELSEQRSGGTEAAQGEDAANRETPAGP